MSGIYFSVTGWRDSATPIMEILMKYNTNAKNLIGCDYSAYLDEIFIVPYCVPEEHSNIIGGDTKYFSRKKRYASLSLMIQYEEFMAASLEGRVRLVVENIVASIQILTQRTKGEFRLEAFLRDVLGDDYQYVPNII